MKRNVVIIIAVLGVTGLLAVGAVAAYVLRPPATPSGELTAIPVAALVDTEVPEATATSEQATETPGQVAVVSTDLIVAELVQAESQARFIVDEILNDQPKTVVGTTDQVAAQIVIDPTNPANVQMGPVTVNARTLVTDSNNRNRAIQNAILETGSFEFITFTPKQFVGLPATGAVGETFAFQIIGDLTVKDITREVTFDLTVTVDSATRLHGLGSTTIFRNQFGLGVIELPFQVASVDQDVIIELEFVAEAVQ